MASQFLWKPSSQGGLNPGALSVILGTTGVKGVGIYDENDKLVENLAQSPYSDGVGTKYYSRKHGNAYGNNLRVKVDYGDRQEAYNIPKGGSRYEGEFGNENPVFSNKGLGGGGSGAYMPAGVQGGGAIGNSALPYYMGGEYPEYTPVNFEPIEGGQYDPIDMENAVNQLGQQNRLGVAQNYQVAQGLGLETLNTELAGLKYFAPAAAALSRGEIAQDNQFNQASRTAQLDSAMPGVRDSLAAQGRRAESYAAGRLPDEMLDRALELDVRSGAADSARMGGFGNNSAAAANISDLMSARERLNIAQYGEGLVSSNINQRQGLELAPTEYSQAGSQIRATPTVDAGTRAQQSVGDLNAATIVNPAQTIQMEQNQRQFQANLQQQTQQFNASTGLSAQEFNSQNQFARDMGLFQYNTGYLGAVSGAEQSNMNQVREDALRAQTTQQFQSSMSEAQDSGNYQAIASVVGQALGSQTSTTNPDGSSSTSSVGGAILSGIGSLFGLGGDDTSGGTSGGTSGSSTSDPSTMDTISSLFGSIFGDSDSSSSDAYGVGTSTSGGTMMSDGTVQARSGSTGGSGSGSSGGGNFGGVSNIPMTKDAQPSGYNVDGEPVYSSPALAKSSNINQGVQAVNMIGSLLSSFGMGSGEDSSALQHVAQKSASPELLNTLSAAATERNPTSFKDKLLEQIDPGGKARDVGNTVNQAYGLYKNWGNMSTAQKSLAVAQLGLKANGYAGGSFASKVIPATNGELTVGEGLGLAAQGYGTVQMVQNWNDMSLQQRIMGLGNTVQNVRHAADVLGYGPQVGSAFNGTAAAAPGTLSLASSGGSNAAPTLLGATRTGTSAASSGASTAGTSTGAVLGQALGAAGGAYGAYTIGQNWGAGTDRAALGSGLGGAAIGAGLAAFGVALGPIGWAALIAGSALTGKMKVGKEQNQVARDSIRNNIANSGLVLGKKGDGKNNWIIENPDGSRADIGIDGNHEKFKVKDPSKLVGDQKDLKDLNAYDTDYTNDMDFTAGLGGIALSRLLNGNTEQHTNQLGSQMGNAGLGNVGHGGEFNQQNFSQVMQNLRSMYVKSGIKDKNSGYELVSQLLGANKVTRADAVGIQQALNMVFDNDFKTAQTLNSGRWNGVRAAAEINKK